MNLDAFYDLIADERLQACRWLEYSVGYDRNDISARFTVEPALPGSVKLTFDRMLKDGLGNLRIIDDFNIAVEPFTIYASTRLGWLQRYLERTGATLT